MRKTGMTAQDVINVLTILKANDSTSFSKIQRALKMSISQLEGIIDGLTAMGILYKSSFTSYSLTELTSKPVGIVTGKQTDIVTGKYYKNIQVLNLMIMRQNRLHVRNMKTCCI